MKVKVQTLDAGKGGDIELNDEIFAVEPRADILHRVVTWQLINRRAPARAARERSDVARTGKKFENGEGSMSKLKAGETAVRVTEEAIQILGGYGYIREFPVEKWHRDAKIYTLFEGTSEIQRLVISRALARD